MKTRPILFNGEMVRAILAGQKTQTRRVMKVQPYNDKQTIGRIVTSTHKPKIGKWNWADHNVGYGVPPYFACPFGEVGDRLYVRETVRVKGWSEDDNELQLEYKADGAIEWPLDGNNDTELEQMDAMIHDAIINIIEAGYKVEDEKPIILPEGVWPIPWKPSIHMPKWASRITLEITDIRVERLQDISGDDAADEVNYVEPYFCGGAHKVKGTPKVFYNPINAFKDIWDSLAKYQTNWKANPWVWVVTFKVIES